MQLKIINDADKIERQKWEKFVSRHPQGNIFQTPFIYNVYILTKNYSPYAFFCIDNNSDEILGVLIGVIQKENSRIYGRLSSRSIIRGGPLVVDQNVIILEKLLKKYDSFIKSKCLYTQFRNLFDMSFTNDIFKKSHYHYDQHLNYHIDLSIDQESLLKNMHYKRRKDLRLAKERNTVVQIDNQHENLNICYEIIKKVYKRVKIPMPHFSHFIELAKKSKSDYGLKTFVAKHNETIIGCRMVLVFKNKIIFDYYAGSDPQNNYQLANHLLPWEIVLWGKTNNYRIFDFGGAGSPNQRYGVREYKRKFGGKEISFGRFEKVHNKLLFKIGKFGYYLWKMFR